MALGLASLAGDPCTTSSTLTTGCHKQFRTMMAMMFEINQLQERYLSLAPNILKKKNPECKY